MARGKLLLAVLVVATLLPGCSGRRLSDLLSRNDYAPLEEIENQEIAVSPGGQQSDFALASDGETEPKRRIRFPSLWKRKDTSSELQDPFEAEATAIAGPTPQINPAGQDEKRQEYLKSLRELEAKTEKLIAEQEATKQAFVDAASKRSNVQTVSASSRDDLKSESFADFMTAKTNGTTTAVKESAENVFAGVQQSAESFADTNPFAETPFAPPEFTQSAEAIQAPAAGDDFAAFVASSESSSAMSAEPAADKPDFQDAPVVSPAAKDRFESELFPDLEAALAEVEPVAKKPQAKAAEWGEPVTEPQDDFGQMFAQQTSPKVATEPTTGTSFDDIFTPEPTQTEEAFTASEAFATAKEEPVVIASNDSAGFNWSAIPTREFKDVTPSNDFAIELPPVEPMTPAVQEDPFRQASSSRPVFSTQEPVSNSGLVIPMADTTQTFADNFAEALPLEVTEPVPVVATTTAPAAEAGGISGRTWLFIVGCLIVLLLLFLPERQNRANG